MDEFQESVAELRKAGDRLFERLALLLGPGPIHKSRIRTRPDWKAVISVLRSCIRREIPAQSEVSLLNQAIKAQSMTLTVERGKADAIRIGMWGQLAVTVHHLAYYANCLADDPRLERYAPICICRRCDVIFLGHRPGQKYCSDECRFKAWCEETRRTNPDYWRDNAAFNRKKRNLREVRQRRHQTVGISEGELSKKRRDKKGRANKKAHGRKT